MNNSRKIKDYFQKTAGNFDKIYSKEKGLLQKLLDFIFRRSMQQRFEVTLKECGDLKGKSVLDIGCGSGRYTAALAQNGAQVTGIDFSENMLDLARRLAAENKVSNRCQFIKTDFLNHAFEKNFDICIAVGILEYFEEPQDFLDKMRIITTEKIIISLPVKYTFRTLIRKIRLTLKKCPVHFYTKEKIKRLLQTSGFGSCTIKKLDRDFLIIIKVQ